MPRAGVGDILAAPRMGSVFESGSAGGRRGPGESRPQGGGPTTTMEFHDLLRAQVQHKASDLFIKVGSPPSIRVDGAVKFLKSDEITPQKTLEIFEILEESKREGFRDQPEIDTSYDLPGIGRFRVNIYRERGYTAFVFRHVQAKVPTFEDLNIPEGPLTKLSSLSRGLVLVTGVTGCGKSTSLAAMINYINEHHQKHIVTIEDPIEFMFKDQRCIVSQREIGVDTQDFYYALKYCVRQSPDVIMIGEMRDKETMEAAIAAAETGHLVFSTLHTVNAQQTVERIINFFPPHQHQLIRLQLSMILEGVVSQRLLPRKGQSGRVPAVELMMRSPTVRDILLEGRTNELYKVIKEGEYFGSQTFNQALRKLYQNDWITLEDAMSAADNPDELKMELKGIVKGTRTTDFDFNF